VNERVNHQKTGRRHILPGTTPAKVANLQSLLNAYTAAAANPGARIFKRTANDSPAP
jgi:hypothetical protein